MQGIPYVECAHPLVLGNMYYLEEPTETLGSLHKVPKVSSPKYKNFRVFKNPESNNHSIWVRATLEHKLKGPYFFLKMYE